MASPQPVEDAVKVEQPAAATITLTSNDNAPQPLLKDQLAILSKVLEDLQKHVDDQGHEICNDFLRVINKRYLPEYYDVIKEVMAFSTIKAKILKKQYTSFKQFVRDLALISHNAQVYNRPSAPVYKDALALRAAVKEELQKLVDNGTVTAEEAELPDLGEIPPVDPSPPPGPDDEEEEEEEEEDEEDEDEDDDSDDDNPKKRSKKKGRRTSGGNKREKGDDEVGASSSKRMRPPKVLTPMEARINNLLKALRKYKNPDGDLKILNFEKLPDKATYPEYYQEIKNPIAMDMIKKKAKRKNYHSVEHVLKDLELMFSNAMEYNQDSSQIYKDAKDLLQEARDIAEFEKKKPDSDFVDEDGKLPLPEILYNGEIWKVGDWVHIENANDAVKPIVAQIYRTWRDGDGQNWVNACWYYRPEQTVHQYQKHFLENEVVKTGRYCDHKIDDVKERCFVMFVTRYFRGRPRGFPADKQVYVCEARYNEEKFEMNKIKTWASCIPDEVRDKDYEMVLFDTPRPNKKVESPIKHLLREDAKEDDPLPKPTWGAPNCPPIVGAVHRRPPPKNQSPPPEPTPPPQQQPAPEPVRQAIMSDRQRFDSQGDAIMSRSSFSNPTPSPMPSHGAGPTQYGHQFSSSRPSISPAPMAHQNSYGSHGSGSQPALPQTPHYQSQSFGQHNAAASTPVLQNTNPVSTHDQYQSSANAIPPTPQSASRTSSKYSPPKVYGNNAYNPPRATEVFTLSEQDNNNIPADIRDQFQKDQFGKVLFFTTPPLVTNAATEQDPSFGHSLSYLADKARAKEAEDKKRKAQHANVGDTIKSAASDKLRRIKANNPDALKHAVEEKKAQYLRENQEKIMLSWAEQHNEGTNDLYRQMYGDQWKEMREQRDRETATAQAQAIQERKAIEDYRKQVEERKKVPITGFSWI